VKTKVVHAKIRQLEFQHFFSFNSCRVFPVSVFYLKNWQFVKEMKQLSVPKFKVDKPATRSQAECKQKNEAQTNFQITRKIWEDI